MSYPAQIDTLPIAVDNLTPISASLFNTLRTSILAIEQELGINPKSIYGTVNNRLNTLENIINSFSSISLSQDLGNTNDNPMVIGIHGRPISDVPPQLNDVYSWNGSAWIPQQAIQPPVNQHWLFTSSNTSTITFQPINNTMYQISPPSGGATITIDDSIAITGTLVIFKDTAGLANLNPITLVFSNYLIDNQHHLIINKSYGNYKTLFDGNKWNIV